MDAQYNYGSSLITPNTNICGVRLLPFSLGHLLLLTESNNPLISGEELKISMKIGTYRFYQALIICSCTFEEGKALLDDPALWIAEWNKFQDNLLKNIAIEPDWNIYTKLQKFKHYMAYYVQSMPDYKIVQRGDAKSTSGTDWRTSISVIFKKLNYTKSEILNMNIRQLFQEWTANAEAEGSIEVLNKFTSDKIKANEAKEKSNAIRS